MRPQARKRMRETVLIKGGHAEAAPERESERERERERKPARGRRYRRYGSSLAAPSGDRGSYAHVGTLRLKRVAFSCDRSRS